MEKKWQIRAGILSLLIAVALVLVMMTSTLSHGQDETIDWSVKLCDSVLARYTPSTFGSWQYPQGLFLEGMWRVYQRTANPQ
jgi:rhamnogalacturonyl hydrolase YesR